MSAGRAFDLLALKVDARDGEIELSGETSGRALLYRSTDLKTWMPVYAFTKTNFTETMSVEAASVQRFFRVVFTNYAVPATFVWIPPGEFLMGSPLYELGRDADEGPQRPVKIGHGFWLSQFETTVKDYEELVDSTPSLLASSPLCPVENVSWAEAVEYCRLRTVRDQSRGAIPPGCTYRLPSEAEWE